MLWYTQIPYNFYFKEFDETVLCNLTLTGHCEFISAPNGYLSGSCLSSGHCINVFTHRLTIAIETPVTNLNISQ